MALELDKISFAVDTQALEQATAKVQELTAALAAIGKMPTVTAGGIAATNGGGESKVEKGVKRTKKTVEDLQKTLDQTAKDIADGFSKSEAAVLRNARAMKATDDQVKQLKESLVSLRKDSDKPVVAPSVTKGVADLGISVDKVTYTIQKQEIAMDVLRGTTLKLSDGELALQRVYTNGQANRIAALKLQGASTEQMTKYTASVKDLNNIMGVNTFDKSAGGFEKISKSVKELQNVDELMREGLGLTRQQVILLSRDIESLRQSYARIGQDTSGTQFANDVASKKSQFATEAQRENLLLERARESDRVAKEIANRQQSGTQMNDQAVALFHRSRESEIERVAKANAFLDRETQRANNALSGLKGTIEGVDTAVGISTANRLNKYSEELKQAGVSADVAKQKLQSYGNTLVETERLNAEKNKKASMERLDYAARATSVQLGDIGISLAGGQNPLLVMIQQGDQLRAVLAQAALSGEELRSVMGTASRQIVTGFVDVGKALGSFVVGAFKDAGSAAANFLLSITGINAITESLVTKVPQAAGAINMLYGAVTAVATAVMFVGVTALASLAIGLGQVIKQENEFTRALAMNGAALNLSRDSAYSLAETLRGTNDTVSSSVKAFSAMAKEGGFLSSQVKLVTQSANEMQAIAGVAVEDTVKSFAKFADTPTKSLIELAKRTGLVSPEVIKLSAELERQGKKSAAASIGMQELSNANSTAAKIIEAEMGSLTKLGNSIGRIWDRVWDSVMGIGRVDTLSERIGNARTQLTNMQMRQSGIPEYLRKTGAGTKEVQEAQNLLDSLLEQERLLAKTNTQKQINIDLSAREARWQERITDSADGAAKFSIVEKQIREDGLRLGKSELEIQRLINAERKKLVKPEARSAEEKFTDKSIRLFTRDAAEAEGKMNDLTKSQVDLLKVIASPEWAKADHKKIIDAYQIALAIDLQNKATEDQLKLSKQMIEAEKDYVDLLTKRHAENKAALITGMKQIDDAVELQNDLEFQMKIIGMTADEQRRLTAERKAYVELRKELADIEKKGEGVDKNTLRAYANTAYNQKLQNATTQSGLDKLIEADKLQQSIADALVTGLTEGGKSGAAKLRNILQAELMKPITVFIKAQLNSLTSGGIPGMTNQIGAGGTSTLGSIVQGLSSAGIGMSLQKGISGGYSTGESKLVDTITAAASAYFGPIAGAAVGVFNRAFGRKLTDSGVQGQYSGNSFAGNSYSFSKGGLFRSNKTSTSSLDPAMQQMLNTTYQGIDKAFTSFADKFNTTVSSSFETIKVNLLGLSESEAQAKLSEAIAGSVKKTLDAINLPKWAENLVSELGDKFSVESMQNALAGIVAMKDALDNLGAASDAFAGITSDATSELIAEFGGIQTATQSLSSYFQNFYPEEQRVEIATTALNKQLAKLGVAIPDSTAAYKALVDDALIAGNEELAANLINLSGAFYEIKNAVEAMTSSVIDEADRLRGEIVGSNSASTVGKTAMLAEFGMMTQLARAGDKSAIEKLPELSKQIEETVKNQAVSQVEVTKIQSYLSNSLYATSQQLGATLPAYVSAINSNQTSVSNLSSNSSVLSPVIQPAGNTASSTAASSQATNAARVEMLLTSLVDNISGLRDEIRADVSHNAKTAKILDRAMQDGQSLTVTVLA